MKTAAPWKFLVSVLGVILAVSVQEAKAAVTVERTGVTWDAYGNFLAKFRLTNGTSQTIYYGGYGPDQPLRWCQLEREAGWEKEEGGAGCGNGLGIESLSPGQSVSFTDPPPGEGRRWRLGIKFSAVQDFTRETPHEMAWTSPMPIVSIDEGKRTEAPAPRMETEVSWHPEQRYDYTFKMTNRSGETLYYAAYRERSVPPLYLMQARKVAGDWRDDGKVDWSGTEMAFRPLHPGEAIEFSIPARGGTEESKDEEWRIGLRFFRSGAPTRPEEACQPVWSRQFPPRGKAPDFAAQ